MTAENRPGPPAPDLPHRTLNGAAELQERLSSWSPERTAEMTERLRGWPLTRLLALAGHATGNRFRRALADEDGLSPGAAGVLTMLAWGTGRGLDTGTPGRATHSDLANRCLIAPATLTGIVSTLEKAGYVRRERDTADRRVVWLVLTEAGATRAQEIGRRASAANGELVRDLSPEFEQLLRDFLITVIENDFAVFQEAPALTDHRTPSADHPESRPRC